jgi:POT family proton-dependent oligopeptide transporter
VVLASAWAVLLGLLGAGMSSPDEEASLVTKLQGYTEGYYQLAICFNCGFTTNSSFSTN